MKIMVSGALILGSILPRAASAVTYYNGTEATSAYVWDWAQGAVYTNYAFKVATSNFVGKWRVDQGPVWNSAPLAYSGQEAAALLFGGSPDDYFISTIDNVAAHADRMTWVSRYNAQCATFAACGVKVSHGFVSGSEIAPVATAVQAIPEPGAWLLTVTGFGIVGLGTRGRARRALV